MADSLQLFGLDSLMISGVTPKNNSDNNQRRRNIFFSTATQTTTSGGEKMNVATQATTIGGEKNSDAAETFVFATATPTCKNELTKSKSN